MVKSKLVIEFSGHCHFCFFGRRVVGEMYWIVAVCSGVVFCRVFYSEVLKIRKETFFDCEHYRRNQVSPVGISGLVGYDPFEIVRQVSLRAGIAPPELLIIRERPFRASILCQGKKAVIVCGASFMAKTAAKEFEGVVAHEIGHFVNLEDSLFRFAWCAFAGFLACGTLLFVIYTISFFSGMFVPGWLFANIHFAGATIYLSLCAVLSAIICFGAHRVLEKKREFSADKRALSLTRYPLDFVNLLSKIANEEDLHANESAIAGVSQAKTRDMHPPMRKRVQVTKKILEKRGVVR